MLEKTKGRVVFGGEKIDRDIIEIDPHMGKQKMFLINYPSS